jgi:hypothetical protein
MELMTKTELLQTILDATPNRTQRGRVACAVAGFNEAELAAYAAGRRADATIAYALRLKVENGDSRWEAARLAILDRQPGDNRLASEITKEFI